MARVSVIVPARDAADVLGRALASVAAQDYDDVEVVVADDASGDATARVARDHGAVVVGTDGPLGPAGARNRALAAAGGELVALLDADDWWLPGYLRRMVGRFDAERGRAGRPLGLVGCDAEIHKGPERVAGTYLAAFRDPLGDVGVSRLLVENPVYVSALVARAAIDAAGGFDEGLFGTEDHDLWLRIVEAGWRAVVTRETLAAYSLSPGSVSADMGRQARNNVLTLERALARGRLTPRQSRAARGQIRYNRALELVASGDRQRMLARAPLLAGVVAANPRRWGDWARVLTGRHARG